MNIWAYRRAYGEWGYLVAQEGTMKQKKGHDMETGMIQGYSTSHTYSFQHTTMGTFHVRGWGGGFDIR